MKGFLICLLLIAFSDSFSFKIDTVLIFEEYLGYVKKYHPIVKQAKLVTSESEIKLMKARGAFDPKFGIDYNTKEFKQTSYYDKLNATFKVPTWYGIELSANYEENDGKYLNNESTIPDEGLYSAKISVSLAKGLIINNRMAVLKQAKLYVKQAEANQRILINNILFQATIAYFNWLKNYQAKSVFDEYLLNAKVRLQNVKTSFFSGDKPAIDTLEAHINYTNRLLDLEKSRVGLIKSSLELSNYLWLENNLPLDLREHIIPDINTYQLIDSVLNRSFITFNVQSLDNHPKLLEIFYKKEILSNDKLLKSNNLLPQIDFEYNFLNPTANNINSLNSSNYKSGLVISFPLFLRKERADLNLVKLKIQDLDYKRLSTELILKNKIESISQQIDSYDSQYDILSDLIIYVKQLVLSEERKFFLGEGSLFLVNYREVKFIENKIKKIDLEYNVLRSKCHLLNILNAFN